MLDLPLTFLQRPAAASAPHPWLLVLMHGVGSNEKICLAWRRTFQTTSMW